MSLWTGLMGQEFVVSQVDAGGISTRSMRMGAGAPLIFLHGITGHLEAFVPTAPLYADEFAVHLIDLLGHGYTDKPGGSYTMQRYAKHLLDYMDAMQIEKAHLCGISLGGWLCGWMLAKHPDRLLRSTMVLPAGTPAMNNPKIRSLVVDKTLDAVMSDDRDYTRQRLEQVIHNKHLVTDELVDVRYTIYHKQDFRDAVDDILAMTDPALYVENMLSPELLARISGEALLVWSEEDAYNEVFGSQYFVDKLKSHKLTIMKDAGHWPPYERPEAFAEVHKAFLKGGIGAVAGGVI
jgi:2-hydroxy-6-oxonona-2,4-dienedioate hydrolase